MLSRIAENLYWMGRYVERAENTARLLGVNYIAMAEAPLVAGSTALVTEQWEPLLDLTDDEDAFRAHHGRADAAAIIEWFAIDRRNPSSVAASLAHARENGRTLRGRISTEMWEALNRTYLELCTRTAITEDELGEFCLAAREAGHLFSGLADATLVRDQGWYFLRLGALVERTDNTLRTLQLRFRLTGTTPAVAAGLEAHRSMALLKSLGAYETFRRRHHRAPSQESMADFLLLSPDLPRSVRYCSDTISNIARALARANPQQGDQFARDARWLSARMGHVGDATQITGDESPGIDELLDDVAALSNVLTQTYFVV